MYTCVICISRESRDCSIWGKKMVEELASGKYPRLVSQPEAKLERRGIGGEWGE